MSTKTVGTEDEDEDDGTSGEKTFGKVPQKTQQFTSTVMTPGNTFKPQGVQLSQCDISNSSELVVSDTSIFQTTGDVSNRTKPQVTIGEEKLEDTSNSSPPGEMTSGEGSSQSFYASFKIYINRLSGRLSESPGRDDTSHSCDVTQKQVVVRIEELERDHRSADDDDDDDDEVFTATTSEPDPKPDVQLPLQEDVKTHLVIPPKPSGLPPNLGREVREESPVFYLDPVDWVRVEGSSPIPVPLPSTALPNEQGFYNKHFTFCSKHTMANLYFLIKYQVLGRGRGERFRKISTYFE